MGASVNELNVNSKKQIDERKLVTLSTSSPIFGLISISFVGPRIKKRGFVSIENLHSPRLTNIRAHNWWTNIDDKQLRSFQHDSPTDDQIANCPAVSGLRKIHYLRVNNPLS